MKMNIRKRNKSLLRLSNKDYASSAFWRFLDEPRLVFVIVTLLFIIYFLPYFVKGEDVYIPQFDNLDQISYLGHFDGHFQGHFFPVKNMEEYYLPGMEPVFRLAILSLPKLFWLLGFFRGYVFNEIIYRLLAFIGFYLLLKYYLMPKLPRLLPAMIAVTYIYLPFWSQGGLSISGLPLLTWILLNLYHGDKKLVSYILLLVYLMYSSLFLTGIFVMAIIGSIIVIRLIFHLNCKRLILPFLLMALVYILVNYPYFLINFVYKIPTNRAEIQLLSVSFVDALQNLFLTFFIKSHVHAPSYHQFILLPASLLSFILILRSRSFTLRPTAILLTSLIIFSALLFALYRFEPINNWYTKLGFGFDYSRLYFLNPPIWYIIPALGIAYGYQQVTRKKAFLIIILLLIVLQLGINYRHSSHVIWSDKPTYCQVMAEEQFDEIEKYLNDHELGFSKSNTRIGCIGFQPAVANFNGFKTLGAYCPIYPLHIKQVFMDILKDEMEKNYRLKLYMQKWGSQLYLFDDQIFINMLDQKYLKRNCKPVTCDLNIAKLKELGVDYLFYTIEVTNAAQKGLKEIYRDTDPYHYYRFYVYAIDQ